MSYYFYSCGSVNFKRLSQVTLFVGSVFYFGIAKGISIVRDEGLNIYIRPKKYFMSDWVFYSRLKPDKNH